jgi:hypothetical protein
MLVVHLQDTGERVGALAGGWAGGAQAGTPGELKPTAPKCFPRGVSVAPLKQPSRSAMAHYPPHARDVGAVDRRRQKRPARSALDGRLGRVKQWKSPADRAAILTPTRFFKLSSEATGC